MSSFPYYYFSNYQEDVDIALQELRQREFEAGRYAPVMFMDGFRFPPDENSIAPGAQHSSIEAAIKAGGAEGTGSILDIQRILDSPDFSNPYPLSTSPLPPEFLMHFFSTDQPTRQLVERVIIEEADDTLDVWDELADELGAGGSRYLIVYKGGAPSEIFFIGYSVD